MSNTSGELEKEIEKAERGRKYITDLKHNQGAIVLCPDNDVSLIESVVSVLYKMKMQFGNVILIVPDGCASLNLKDMDQIRIIKLPDELMQAVLNYALLARHLDRSIKIVSMNERINGILNILYESELVTEDTVIQRGLLELVG